MIVWWLLAIVHGYSPRTSHALLYFISSILTSLPYSSPPLYFHHINHHTAHHDETKNQQKRTASPAN